MNFSSQPLNFAEQTSLFKYIKVKPRYPKTFVSFANSVCEYQTSSQGSGLKCISVINVNVISQNSSSLFVSLLIISGSYQGFCSYQGIFLVKRRTKSPITGFVVWSIKRQGNCSKRPDVFYFNLPCTEMPSFFSKFFQSLFEWTVVSVSSIWAEILNMLFLSACKTTFVRFWVIPLYPSCGLLKI